MKKMILLITCIAVALSVQGGKGGFGYTGKKTQPIVTAGEGIEFTVLHIYKRKSLPDGREAPSKRKFFVVDIRTKNLLKDAQFISPLDFSVVADGKETCAAGAKYFIYNSGDDFEGGSLHPGTYTEGLICFEIPFDAEKLDLYYSRRGNRTLIKTN